MASTMNPDFLREAIRLSIEKMESNEGGPFGPITAMHVGQITVWRRAMGLPNIHELLGYRPVDQ